MGFKCGKVLSRFASMPEAEVVNISKQSVRRSHVDARLRRRIIIRKLKDNGEPIVREGQPAKFSIHIHFECIVIICRAWDGFVIAGCGIWLSKEELKHGGNQDKEQDTSGRR